MPPDDHDTSGVSGPATSLVSGVPAPGSPERGPRPGTLGAGTLGAGTVGAGTVGAGTVGPGTVGAGTVGAGTVGAGTVGPGTVGADWAVRWTRRTADLMAEHRAWLTDLDRAIGDADHGENMHRGFTAVLARLDAGAALGPAGVPDSVAAVLQLVAMTLMSSVGGAAGPLYGTAYLRAGQRCAALVAESASDTVGDAVGDAGGDAVGETVGGTAGDAGDTVGGTVGDAADTVGGAVGDAADTVGGTVGDAADHRDVPGPPGELGAREVVGLLEAALGGIVARGKATPGEKTMVDAWTPALHAARAAEQDGADATGTLRAAADAAQAGAAATEPLVATKGRASYLGERSVGHRDPGAASSALILRAAAECAADPAVGAPLGTP